MTQVESTLWPLHPAAAPPPFAGEGATLRQVQVPAGTVANRHSHAHEQFLIVTAGAGTLQCETGEITLQPGALIRLAAGAWHSATFAEPTVIIEVNLKEPPTHQP